MPSKMRAQFRPVNPMLGIQPRLGPFPAEHFLPWLTIAFTAYLVCQVFLNLGWLWTSIFAVWGISTWWILSGNKPWRFLSRFTPTPYWTRGYCRYRLMLPLQHSHRKNLYESKTRFNSGS